MYSIKSLLYKDSPFLPSATQQSLEKIGTDINTHHLPPIIAIAKEVSLIGVELNKTHQVELESITPGFRTVEENIDNFLLGFITPPTLIVGGFTMKTRGFIEAIKLYCPPTNDSTLIRHNGYKTYHLLPAYNIISSALYRLPKVGATPIYALCKGEERFLDDPFYLTGLEASEMLFTEISDLIYPF